ncbi:MAG TPA: MarR family transcriptional regulator [Mycobacterium sp.]|uniref:MarR family winged helix-turn-helix transcriptional regulator n=1 Tax=Mycobacterium sp. TaxID=1785 RepID=UPI002F42B05B
MTTPQADRPAARARRRRPTKGEIAEVVGFVPLLSAFFQRARADMPPRLRESFAAHSLGPRHGAVLIQMYGSRPLSVTELADRLGNSLPTVSELVGDLERAGLVQRQVDSTNRRRTLVSLADERSEQIGEFLELRAAPLLRALDQLTTEQRAGFVRGLRLWVDEAGLGENTRDAEPCASVRGR